MCHDLFRGRISPLCIGSFHCTAAGLGLLESELFGHERGRSPEPSPSAGLPRRGIPLPADDLDVDHWRSTDGIELAERLRQDKPEIKVLIMSGSPDRASEAVVKRLPFLRKPFSLADLTDGVREVLSGGNEFPRDHHHPDNFVLGMSSCQWAGGGAETKCAELNLVVWDPQRFAPRIRELSLIQQASGA